MAASGQQVIQTTSQRQQCEVSPDLCMMEMTVQCWQEHYDDSSNEAKTTWAAFRNAAQSGMLAAFAAVEADLTSNPHLHHFRSASLLMVP